ncbi:MAG: RHS repeat-associated core domain-containing protein, partial [Planctomycetes bacterium]|nr:RHS repeat-associated core domain-containing protein [Planctomycetota bacterium]
ASTTAVATSSVGLPFLWKAVRLDAETGLLYMRNRYYSTGLGRFLTRDPLGVWGDVWNLGCEYGYVGCGPLTREDPLGLQVDSPSSSRIASGDAQVALSLTPGDFLRPPPSPLPKVEGGGEIVAAATTGELVTFSGRITTRFLRNDDGSWACYYKWHYTVRAYFSKAQSWMHPDYVSVLRHEQGHFLVAMANAKVCQGVGYLITTGVGDSREDARSAAEKEMERASKNLQRETKNSRERLQAEYEKDTQRGSPDKAAEQEAWIQELIDVISR